MATAAPASAVGTKPLVTVENLQKRFPVSTGLFERSHSFVHAVDGVSFELARGESFGLVGESGCGKTTTGRLLVRLAEPSDGRVLFDESGGAPTDITHLAGADLKAFRRRAQMIFQDPYESLNPRRTIFDTVAEPLKVQSACGPHECLERVSRMLEMVGLTPPAAYLFRYPHELSGGQRQRAAIARALVIEPIFVVADEPTSMLDVSIRTGVMQLMQGLADRLGISYLYITHDLAVARYMCSRIAVMYLGKSSRWATPKPCCSIPSTPIPRRCCPRCRFPTPPSPAPQSESPAASPRRWTRSPAAASTTAAPSPTTSAATTTTRRSRTRARDSSRLATRPKPPFSRELANSLPTHHCHSEHPQSFVCWQRPHHVAGW